MRGVRPVEGEIPRLEDLDLEGKRIFLRSDMNVPIDSDGGIMDETKIRQAADTVREILDRGAAVVVGTHQGRPGTWDFTSTEQHAAILAEVLGVDVMRVDSVLSSEARSAINQLRPGDVLMLENLRFHSEENIEADPRDLLRTHFVRRLAPLFDAYVNDAFQASHRSQPSLVAFPYILPSAAGRLMERMLAEMREIESTEGTRAFLVGGAKVEDKLRVIEHALRTGRVNVVLTGGLIGVLMASAAGHDVGDNLGGIKKRGILIPAARELLRNHGDRVYYPVDFVVDLDGRETSVPVYAIPPRGRIVDIGPGTVSVYAERIRENDVIIANGPMGLFEDPRYRRGTIEMVRAAAQARREAVLCGGHLSVAARMAKAEGCRVYTAGGAVLYSLAGLPLPAVEALVRGRTLVRGGGRS